VKTVQDLRTASALKLCYTDEQIQAFIDRRDAVGWAEALLELPPSDACWALAGWLSPERRVEWAQASARRAQEYASAAWAAWAAAYADAAARAAWAADATAHAAADAAWAAARAAAYADAAARAAATYTAAVRYAAAYADACRAEYGLSVRHGAMLLEQQLTEEFQ
jgi:hypothetical protein